eukprot:COSAG04_NODE_111_length_25781_cov_90.291761_22_plen_397_part_00
MRALAAAVTVTLGSATHSGPTYGELVTIAPTTLPVEGGATLRFAVVGGPLPSSGLCCDFNGDTAPIGGESPATPTAEGNGSCVVPRVNAEGAASVRLFLTNSTCVGGHRTAWLNGSAAATFKASLSFAPGRRPYVSETHGALVVRTSPAELIASWLPAAEPSALTLTLSATLDRGPGGGPPLALFPQPRPVKAGRATALAFDLARLPAHIDAAVTAVLTVWGGASHQERLLTINSTRLLQRFTASSGSGTSSNGGGSGGSVVQLDRHRRSLLVDGDVFQGVGWYIGGGDFTVPFTRKVDELAKRGVNMIMVYSFEKKQGGGGRPTAADLAPFMAHCASVGMMVMFDLMPWFEDYSYCAAAMSKADGCATNTTYAERALREIVNAGTAYSSLLGWYM